MKFKIFTPKDKHFPKRLTSGFGSVFPRFTAVGNLDILINSQTAIIGLFCSRSCPGSLILPALDHVRILRDTGRTVIGGFIRRNIHYLRRKQLWNFRHCH